MITKEILEETAKQKGLLNKEHIEKDYFQDLLLFNLYKQTNLLVFKGGTALYKLYGLQRFSEDLDFSLLKDVDLEKIMKNVIANIKNSEIKEIKRMKDSVLIKIAFKGILTKYNTIRIDINTKNPVLDKFDVKTYTSSYVDINPFSLRVLSLKEIFAEKIHSILNRENARDLYDLFFLSKFVEIDKKIITNKLANFNMKFDFNELRQKIGNLESLWKKELEPFILSELPDFKAVRDFVLNKLKKLK